MVALLGFDFFNVNPHRPPEPQTERYVRDVHKYSL